MSEDDRLHTERIAATWREAYESNDLLTVLKALYDMEINVGMQAFWDGGWDVWFGDEMNGKRRTEHFRNEDFGEVVSWLTLTAEELHPVLRRYRMGIEAYV